MKPRALSTLLVFMSSALGLGALEFSLRPAGFALIPVGARAEYFSPGGGGRAGFDLNVSNIFTNPLGLGYTAGIETAYEYSPLAAGAGGGLQLTSFGGGLGFYHFPLPRLHLRLETAAGVYSGNSPNASSSWYYLRAGGEAGFRFSPAFILSANGGFAQFGNKASGGILSRNVYAGISLQFTIQTSQESGSVEAETSQPEPVFPVFLSLYQKSEAAALTIVNRENAEIRDVQVSFLASPYTASEYPCGTIPFIPRGRSAEIPLYADFAPELLRFTENGRVTGSVVIRYRFLGKERQTVQTAAIRVYNRNYFPRHGETSETSALAAFVSPTSPEVLEFSRYITGLARNGRRLGLNQNMQHAAWLYEGFRAADIGVKREPEHRIQFPAETLVYRSGGVRDMALLYAAALEASGIAAAFIPVQDDFIVAASLGLGSKAAESLFNGTKNILILDDAVWLPVSMASLERGFDAAWHEAIEKLDDYFESGNTVEFTSLEAAWGIFPPAPFPALNVRITNPAAALVAFGAGEAMSRYVASEIGPLLEKQEALVRASPQAVHYNRLGILLARVGRLDEAIEAYEEAAGKGSIPAMTNLGGMALNAKDYAAAERWFNRVLSMEPGNEPARQGLQRAQKK
jgi:tetratricopeptide (TPR) repeat protein